MVEILRGILPYLGGAIGLLILVFLVREGWRSLRKSRVKSQEEKCLDLIKRVHHLTTEGLAAVALELKKSFVVEVIETVLDQYRDQSAGITDDETRRKIANLYDHLGLVEQYIRQTKEGKSWTDRAGAAEKLGQIGHSGAVLPLIAVLQDPHEETEVKSIAMRSLGKIRDARAIEPLLSALGSPDPTTGQPLADVLAQFGKEALSILHKTLQTSTQEGQRTWCARILGRINAPESVPSLLNALSDHSEKVREAAAQSLGRLKDRRAVRPLNEILLMDPSPLVRETAAQVLGEIGDEKAIEYLKRALGDMEYGARLKAMEAMEAMGEQAWPVFLEVLKTGDNQARSQAAIGLERGGYVSRAIEQLGDEKTKTSSLELLLLVAKAGVVETIIRSLAHADFRIRIRLCEILRDAPNSRAIESLLGVAQQDPEWPVRLRALQALVAIGDERALPVIVRSLKGEEETTRASVLETIEKLSQKLLLQLLPELTPFLHDSNIQVRTKACEVIGRIASDQVFLPLLASLKDPSQEVRARAAHSFATLVPLLQGGASPRGEERVRKTVVVELVQSLKDPSNQVRMEAVKSLGALQEPTAIPALAQCFEWADDEEREVISEAIATVPQQEIFPLIDELMGLAVPKARAGVAWTLGLLSDPKGMKLASLFLKDPEPMVRSAAAGAMGNWFEKNVEGEVQADASCEKVAQDLLPYLQDPHERVRAAVVNALARVGDATVIDPLLNMLKTEPDLFVCQRAVLAMGCLAREASSPSLPVTLSKVEGFKECVKNWLDRTDDDVSPVASVICLALWQDESAIAEGVKALQSEKRTKILKGLLKGMTRTASARFFKLLSLDPLLFWKEERSEKEVAEHYQHLLVISRSPQERIRALRALATLHHQGSIPQIESSFAKDPDTKVRAEALRGLCQFLKGPLLLDKILIAVTDPSDEVRRAVLPILKEMTPKELNLNREKLVPLLDSPLEEIRTPVTKLLSRLFQNDWQFLADALLGAEKKSRILGLIETLGRTGDPKAGALFLRFLQSRDPEIREFSIEWASEAGLLSEEKLTPLLEDPRESVRISAVRGLGRQLMPETLPALLSRLSDPSPAVRIEISLALGRRKLPDDERPIQILKALIQDLNAEVKIQSLISLFRLGEKGLSKELHAVVSELEKGEKQRLCARLETEGVLLELVSRLKQDRHVDLRKEALEFLAALDLARFASEISESLQDPASSVRIAAIEALGQMDEPLIQSRIEALIQDPVEEVRQAVKRRKLRTVK